VVVWLLKRLGGVHMKSCLKFTVFVLLGILMLSSFTYAEDATLIKTYSAIDRTNIRIEDTIDKAVAVADILVVNDISTDVIIDTLIDRTDLMTAVMIKNAARNSVTVVSEYVEVEIGGKTVLVDPCRVINY
jgi:hypothetical protein